MIVQLNRLSTMIRRHQLLAGLVVAITISLLMTSLSMYLYVRSGASGLDLSRPGFKGEQSKVQRERTFDFSSTGKLSQKDYDNFVKLFDEQRRAIQSAGSFDSQTLSDEALGLTVSPIVSPGQ